MIPADRGDRPPGVILAGGLSRRMGGGDKGLLPLGQGTVLSHVIARLAPQVRTLALNANGDPDRFAPFGLPVLPDTVPDFPGPLAGVLAGLDWAAESGADRIVTAAADTPFFPDDLVARLEQAASGMATPLVLATTTANGAKRVRHPTFGLWPVALRADLRSALADGVRKVVIWTEAHNGREADFTVTGLDPFFNVNTPGDLVRAGTLLGRHA